MRRHAAARRPRASHEKHDDGIRDRGLRHVAGLLPADDAQRRTSSEIAAPLATARRQTSPTISASTHGASQAGSAAVIPRSIVLEIRSIQAALLAAVATPGGAEAMAAEGAETAVVVAETAAAVINATRRREKGPPILICRKSGF